MSEKEKLLFVGAGLAGLGYATWKTMFPWIGDDVRTTRAIFKMFVQIRSNFEKNRLLLEIFEETVSNFPKKPFLIFEDRKFSYEFIDNMANKVANLVSKWSLPRDSSVAIMMENEPAFVWTLLGLQKVGLVGAFINYHLKAHPLIHCIKTSGASYLIIGSGDGLIESISEIRGDLDASLHLYVQGKFQRDIPGGFIAMDDLLIRTLPVPVCKTFREGINMLSPLCYIYTSGTTGLPKPAIVNQAKASAVSKFWQCFDYSHKDISYAVTPLYHSASTTMALFNTIDAGATMVLRRKFSARHFWEDVRKHNVTVIQYIGELCRYLLRVPKSDLDGQHNVRMVFGNGLRVDIWEEFKNRFKIPKIIEFFGATEGTSSLVNITGKAGAIGRMSPFMKAILFRDTASQVNFIKYDIRKDEVIRDKNGNCIKINPGEEGLIISGISDESYSGFYKGSNAMNEKKILRDVFRKGDRWFTFGDLIYLDKDYNVFFRDRLGDTFRWKSENVSTAEVANAICTLPFIRDVNVFGVTVPGEDGRAGMAAILLKRENDEITQDKLRAIYDCCVKELPSYARPLFLRFMPEFVVTQTMKNRKIELTEEAYDLSKVKDPLFYIDNKKKSYIPLNESNFQSVLSSKL